MYGIIPYAEAFEYYIEKKNKKGSLNINKNFFYYSVKNIRERKTETPGKNVLTQSDWKEQNKT